MFRRLKFDSDGFSTYSCEYTGIQAGDIDVYDIGLEISSNGLYVKIDDATARPATDLEYENRVANGSIDYGQARKHSNGSYGDHGDEMDMIYKTIKELEARIKTLDSLPTDPNTQAYFDFIESVKNLYPKPP